MFSALLGRAQYEAPALDALLGAIHEEETSELLRSAGRIESRQRFKYQSGQPLHEERVDDFLFLDESGRSDFRSPGAYFVLGGIAMDPHDVQSYVERADDLKLKFFGRTDITFHEPDIRNHRDWFSLGGSPDRQKDFCDALDILVTETPLTVFAVGIRKEPLAYFQGSGDDPYLPLDPYAITIHLLLERYVDYLASRGDDALGQVTFESVGPLEDAQHHRDYLDLLLDGTQWVQDSAFRNWLRTGCNFTRKQGSDPMELADMVTRDVYEWVRDGCGEGVPRRWSVWQSRMYARDDGLLGKFGIKVFPDSDIRDRIEEHRRKVMAQAVCLRRFRTN